MDKEHAARIFLLCFFGTLGLGLVAWSTYHVVRGEQAKRWLPAEGVVRSAFANPTGRRTAIWRVDIHYSYDVDGHRYTGSRARYGFQDWFFGQSSAEQAAQRIPEGIPIAIRVDPEDPERSVISPGTRRLTMVPAAVGLLSLALGIGGYTSRQRLTR